MGTTSTTLPEGIQFSTVQILGKSDAGIPGKVAFKIWSDKERKSRAFRRTFKIVGGILGGSLIGLFVHILIPFILVVDFLTILISFPLFLKFSGEKSTFFYVEGTCPHCGKAGQLRPYLNAQVDQAITVQCPDCGQTTRATGLEAVI